VATDVGKGPVVLGGGHVDGVELYIGAGSGLSPPNEWPISCLREASASRRQESGFSLAKDTVHGRRPITHKP